MIVCDHCQRRAYIGRGPCTYHTIFVDPEPTKENQMSNVTHPAHYNAGKFEVIEIIEDQGLGFHLGNAIKYICRAGKKDPAKYVEDLEKAHWYLQRAIELQKPEPRCPNDMNPES